MTTIIITGASDDLIEIDGDLEEEFNYRERVENLLAFADGTVLDIRYDGPAGIWRIALVALGEGTEYNIKQAPANDDDHYTDKATMTSRGPIDWCVHGLAIAKKKG